MLDYKNIGKNVKYYRTKVNLTQNELAEKLNVSNNYISQIECGKKISLEKLNQIAELLNINIVYLIGDSNSYMPDYLNKELFRDINELTKDDKELLHDFISIMKKRRKMQNKIKEL